MNLLEVKDPNFKKKNVLLIRTMAALLVFVNKSRSLPEFQQSVSNSGLNLSELILTHRQFNAAKKNLQSTIRSYVIRLEQLNWTKVPPARYIGVGYKDKGSRKISSHDGSPSWQEVASSITVSEEPLAERHDWFRDLSFFEERTTIYEDSQKWIQLVHQKVRKSFSLGK